jgi:SM-20-related protein
MFTIDFFRRRGIFLTEDFLSANLCESVRTEMDSADGSKATIGKEGKVNEESRRTLDIAVSAETRRLITERLLDLRPALEAHFHLPLSDQLQGPSFLMYDRGGFYGPHRDCTDDSPGMIRDRRVSLVLFLNGPSIAATTDSFGDGGLIFYGLISGADSIWSKSGFPLEPRPGLLVAFRSDLLHEVKPVSYGRRYSIAGWFAKQPDTSS